MLALYAFASITGIVIPFHIYCYLWFDDPSIILISYDVFHAFVIAQYILLVKCIQTILLYLSCSINLWSKHLKKIMKKDFRSFHPFSKDANLYMEDICIIECPWWWNGLMTPCIEKDMLDGIHLETIIDWFWSRDIRRNCFIWIISISCI